MRTRDRIFGPCRIRSPLKVWAQTHTTVLGDGERIHLKVNNIAETYLCLITIVETAKNIRVWCILQSQYPSAPAMTNQSERTKSIIRHHFYYWSLTWMDRGRKHRFASWMTRTVSLVQRPYLPRRHDDHSGHGGRTLLTFSSPRRKLQSKFQNGQS